jgi:hypothetical protein
VKRQWKPGDVAMGTIHGYTGLFTYRGEDEGWAQADGADDGWDGDFILNLRPVIVIDPEDREQVKRLISAIPYAALRADVVERTQAALRELANPRPPKPDEPTGLGAVVEDSNGERFVRSDVVTCNPWRGPDGYPHEYDRIDAVRLLSEGVS